MTPQCAHSAHKTLSKLSSLYSHSVLTDPCFVHLCMSTSVWKLQGACSCIQRLWRPGVAANALCPFWFTVVYAHCLLMLGTGLRSYPHPPALASGAYTCQTQMVSKQVLEASSGLLLTHSTDHLNHPQPLRH